MLAGTFTELPLPIPPYDSLGTLLSYTLVNYSDVEQYRLRIINHDTLSIYSETLVLDGIEIYDTLYAKGSIDDRIIIELGTPSQGKRKENIVLSVYPNPADENIFATAYSLSNEAKSRKIQLTVYSLLGKELYRCEIQSGETTSIPTGSLQPGSYYLRAQEMVDTPYYNTLPFCTETFIINR